MQITENTRYLAVIHQFISDFPYWDELNGKTLFISGATGMIGSFLVDAVDIQRNRLPFCFAANSNKLRIPRTLDRMVLTGSVESSGCPGAMVQQCV